MAEPEVLVGFDDDLAGRLDLAGQPDPQAAGHHPPRLEKALGPRLHHPAALELLIIHGAPDGLRAATAGELLSTADEPCCVLMPGDGR